MMDRYPTYPAMPGDDEQVLAHYRGPYANAFG